MGCCLSTENGPVHHEQDQISALKKPLQSHNSNGGIVSDAGVSKSPPRAEEETVKEVLSETPRPRSQILKTSKFDVLGEEESKIGTPKKQSLEKPKRETKSPEAPLLPNITTPEEISEASEICSLSESLEVSTTTASHPPESQESRQRVNRSPARVSRKGSFSGDFGSKREHVTGRSPVRRSDPSPRRRNEGIVTPSPGPDPGQGMIRRGLGVDGQRRRDAGESSGRRSSSPVTRIDGPGGGGGSNLGRSPSGRKSGPSPGRVRMVQSVGESGRKAAEEENTHKWGSQAPNESLENPLVSLECFIFL